MLSCISPCVFLSPTLISYHPCILSISRLCPTFAIYPFYYFRLAGLFLHPQLFSPPLLERLMRLAVYPQRSVCDCLYMCVTETVRESRETERREGGRRYRHLSLRGRDWTTQISPSPCCPQRERALWGEDKHPFDFRFKKGKYTIYKPTLAEWLARQHSWGKILSFYYFFCLTVCCTHSGVCTITMTPLTLLLSLFEVVNTNNTVILTAVHQPNMGKLLHATRVKNKHMVKKLLVFQWLSPITAERKVKYVELQLPSGHKLFGHFYVSLAIASM